MEFSHYLQHQQQLIEARLDELVASKSSAPYAQLFSAGRHALLGGGKRLRPILAMATADAFGVKEGTVLSAACALEMIHTYSLIHDDLPCMDDDDFRRGKPTVHKAFTEAHAVLTGDFLLTYAFEVIAKDPLLSAEQKIALIELLAQKSGGEGMIAGQVMDIEAEGKLMAIEQLKSIHEYKTGAMITASVLCGGIVAKASPSQMHVLGQFGDQIGLAFQIIDDVLDVTASHAKHGKSFSSDIANNKSTYATVLGLEPARQMALDLLHSAHKQLDALCIDDVWLRQLSHYLISRPL